MYSNKVDVFDMKVNEGERKAQEGWRFGYARGVASQTARAVLTRVVAFLRNALRFERESATSVGESLARQAMCIKDRAIPFP